MGSPSPPPVPPSLARQASVYSLTFDEFQSTLGGASGKDFGSMNMDELLKSIWTAEESQALALAAAGGGMNSVIQKQGLMMLPRTLSQKTVDEVWRGIMPESGPSFGRAAELPYRWQPTLGEMTLEEFLVRTGVVREYPDPAQPVASVAGLPVTASGARPYGMPLCLGHQQGIMGGGLIDIRDPGLGNGTVHGLVGSAAGGVAAAAAAPPAHQMLSEGLGAANRGVSAVSPAPYVFGAGLRGRKGAVEKVAERRRKRMIKNRESAARSRARKAAYTMELEVEVAKLKELNQELQRKQDKIQQALEVINQQRRPTKPRLRRTATGPW